MPESTARTRHLLALATTVMALVWAAPATPQILRDDLWVTDGPVRATLLAGSTLYLGGEFDRVGPPIGGWTPVDSSGQPTPPSPQVAGTVFCSTPDGNGGWFIGGAFIACGKQSRSNLAHLDRNGNLTPWAPAVNGPVYAALLFAGKLYVGGAFTTVGGQARNHLAALDTLTAAVAPWNPSADGDVHAIIPFGSTFIIGGTFTHVAGLVRGRIAGVDTTGTVWAWDPEANGTVWTIGIRHTLVPNTVTVYAGGDFTAIGGQPRSSLAAIDATSGAATFGQATAFNPSPDNTVRTLLVFGTLSPTIYVGGDFSTIGGQTRHALAALSGSGAATSWNPGVGGNGQQRSIVSVYALALRGSTLYVGGGFANLGSQPRDFVGAVDTGTGAVAAWDPAPNSLVFSIGLGDRQTFLGGSFTSLGGVVRHNVAALDLATGQPNGWSPNANAPVSALANVAGLVYAGGQFTSIGGATRHFVAQLDASTGAAGSWAPEPNGEVTCIGGRAITAGRYLVYFGGVFTSASGLQRRHLAAMSTDVLNPTLSTWNPSADTTVNALAVSGSTIFVGGGFTQVGGQARSRLAALDLTGAATAWNPGADAAANALAATGSLVYAGGAFANVGGQLHRGIVAIDKATGAVQAWPAQVFGPVDAIAVTAGAIFAGGSFTNVGGQARTNLTALDAGTGAPTSWDPEPWTPPLFVGLLVPSGVNALAEQSGRVYAGGGFATVLGAPHANVAGIFEGTVDVPVVSGPPARANVIEAQPNPSRSDVLLQLTLARAGPVSVQIVDATGRRVRVLRSAHASAGRVSLRWDGRDDAGRVAAPGIYLVQARAADVLASGRVLRLP